MKHCSFLEPALDGAQRLLEGCLKLRVLMSVLLTALMIAQFTYGEHKMLRFFLHVVGLSTDAVLNFAS
jgi:hypothetical protein